MKGMDEYLVTHLAISLNALAVTCDPILFVIDSIFPSHESEKQVTLSIESRTL